ncbi:MAG TPA: hypothetical protein PK777_11345 [Thermoguttaceae bacterium]|nr:hypothetical protein [Thermoguttaceae bacterium]HPP53538.1 hypothetical protein [Thermoguttaceae bacterium]
MTTENRTYPEEQPAGYRRREWFCWLGRQVSLAGLAALAALLGLRPGKPASPPHSGCPKEYQPFRLSPNGGEITYAGCRSCPEYQRCFGERNGFTE